MMVSQFCSKTSLADNMHEVWSDDTNWLWRLLLREYPSRPSHVLLTWEKWSKNPTDFPPFSTWTAWLRAEKREPPVQFSGWTYPFPRRTMPPTMRSFTTQVLMRQKCLYFSTTLKIFTLVMKVIYFLETVQNRESNRAHHKRLWVRTYGLNIVMFFGRIIIIALGLLKCCKWLLWPW